MPTTNAIFNTQPASSSLKAAYRPIYFNVSIDHDAPIVFCDIYFDGTYYATVSTTVLKEVTGGTYYKYEFDIQTKVQEYLNSNGLSITGGAKLPKASSSCYVKIRATQIDSNGFTIRIGTEVMPVQASYGIAATSGDGTQSNTFTVLNASLQHLDNQDLATHLTAFKSIPGTSTTGYGLTHRPKKYYTCKNDFVPFCFYSDTKPNRISIDPDNDSGWVVPFVGTGAGVYFVNLCIDYLATIISPSSLITSLTGDITLFILDASDNIIATAKQTINECGCCGDDKVRLFFLNNVGGWDGINFELPTTTTKVVSGNYQNGLPLVLDNKRYTGLKRFQPLQNDAWTAVCNCYTEDDQNWIKELLGSPQAYMFWTGTQSQSDDLVPIVIDDVEYPTLKNDERYTYPVVIKFRMANETINLR